MNNQIIERLEKSNKKVISLSGLNINHTRLDAIVDYFIQNNISPEYLDISNNNLNAKSIPLISKLLIDDNLKFLNINNNKIGVNGALTLTQALKKSSLQSLRLDNNYIGPLGALSILSELKNNSIGLKFLSLKHNHLTPYLSLKINQLSKEKKYPFTVKC